MNSGYRKSSGRAKISSKINNRSSALSSERNNIEEFKIINNEKIDEEDEDEEAGNISESLILPSTPKN